MCMQIVGESCVSAKKDHIKDITVLYRLSFRDSLRITNEVHLMQFYTIQSITTY